MQTVELTPHWELIVDNGSLSLAHVVGEDRYILELGWLTIPPEADLQDAIDVMRSQGITIHLQD